MRGPGYFLIFGLIFQPVSTGTVRATSLPQAGSLRACGELLSSRISQNPIEVPRGISIQIDRGGATAFLGEKGLTHILTGDVTLKPMAFATSSGSTTLRLPVLAGGAHTWAAMEGLMWQRFQTLEPWLSDIAPSFLPSFWAQKQTLKNGVIRVRLPKDFFSAKALDATWGAYSEGKSGYAWKTLFPEAWDRGDIAAAVAHVIGSAKNTEKRSLTGTYRGVQLQVFLDPNGNVISAFPTWAQRRHKENFFVTAFKRHYAPEIYSRMAVLFAQSSSEYFPHSLIVKNSAQVFPTPEALVQATPALFLQRKRLSGQFVSTSKTRERQLNKWARTASASEVAALERYLHTPALFLNPHQSHRILADAFGATHLKDRGYERGIVRVWNTLRAPKDMSPELFHALMLESNLYEGLVALQKRDRIDYTTRAAQLGLYILKNLTHPHDLGAMLVDCEYGVDPDFFGTTLVELIVRGVEDTGDMELLLRTMEALPDASLWVQAQFMVRRGRVIPFLIETYQKRLPALNMQEQRTLTKLMLRVFKEYDQLQATFNFPTDPHVIEIKKWIEQAEGFLNG